MNTSQMKLPITLAVGRSFASPYLTVKTFEWDKFADSMECPTISEVKDGHVVVLAAMVEPYRKTENVSYVTAFGYDVESHGERQPPKPADTHHRLLELDWVHVIYTTHSHAPDSPRYRVIVMLDRGVTPDDYKRTRDVLVTQMGLDGFTDEACKDVARAFLMPVVHPERADLYEFYKGGSHPIHSGTIELIAARRRADAQRRRDEAMRRAAKRHIHSRGCSVIERFNNAYRVTDVLELNGYEPIGKRYSKPGGSSHVPGVVVLDDGKRVYTHHSNDPLGDGKPHDAFDVMRILECGGVMSSAIDKAREMMGENK